MVELWQFLSVEFYRPSPIQPNMASSSSHVRPWTVPEFSDRMFELKHRLAHADIAAELQEECGWEYGVPREVLLRWIRFWKEEVRSERCTGHEEIDTDFVSDGSFCTGRTCVTFSFQFSWKEQREKIDSLPNFLYKTSRENGDLDIHFIHLRSSRPDAIPILLIHGWPGSSLSDPTRVGWQQHLTCECESPFYRLLHRIHPSHSTASGAYGPHTASIPCRCSFLTWLRVFRATEKERIWAGSDCESFQ